MGGGILEEEQRILVLHIVLELISPPPHPSCTGDALEERGTVQLFPCTQLSALLCLILQPLKRNCFHLLNILYPVKEVFFKALVIVLKLERQDFLYDGCQQYLMQFLEAGCTPRSIKLCSRRHSCTHLYIMGGNKVREEASCWLKTL